MPPCTLVHSWSRQSGCNGSVLARHHYAVASRNKGAQETAGGVKIHGGRHFSWQVKVSSSFFLAWLSSSTARVVHPPRVPFFLLNFGISLPGDSRILSYSTFGGRRTAFATANCHSPCVCLHAPALLKPLQEGSS